MTSINNWIYARLEHICGSLSGISVIALDIPNILLKLVLAVVLGFLGAMGAHLWKVIEKKLKKK